MSRFPNRSKRGRLTAGSARNVKLTAAQFDALISAATFCLAGEWPFDDVRAETMQRAADALRDAAGW